tara:strand:- start:52 stop:246 length:195 start_codon:yes stop_codon:yes gene_type:complete
MSQNQFPKVDLQLTSDCEVENENFYQINPRYGTSEFCTPYLIEEILKMDNQQFFIKIGWRAFIK